MNLELFAQIPTEFLAHWLQHTMFFSHGQREILFIGQVTIRPNVQQKLWLFLRLDNHLDRIMRLGDELEA